MDSCYDCYPYPGWEEDPVHLREKMSPLVERLCSQMGVPSLVLGAFFAEDVIARFDRECVRSGYTSASEERAAEASLDAILRTYALIRAARGLPPPKITKKNHWNVYNTVLRQFNMRMIAKRSRTTVNGKRERRYISIEIGHGTRGKKRKAACVFKKPRKKASPLLPLPPPPPMPRSFSGVKVEVKVEATHMELVAVKPQFNFPPIPPSGDFPPLLQDGGNAPFLHPATSPAFKALSDYLGDVAKPKPYNPKGDSFWDDILRECDPASSPKLRPVSNLSLSSLWADLDTPANSCPASGKEEPSWNLSPAELADLAGDADFDSEMACVDV